MREAQREKLSYVYLCVCVCVCVLCVVHRSVRNFVNSFHEQYFTQLGKIISYYYLVTSFLFLKIPI